MSNGTCCGINWKQTLLFAGVVIGLLLGGVLARRMQRSEPPPGPRAARAAERAKKMAEHRAAVEKESGYGVINKEGGIYRIPIERAMEITAAEWRNPSAARANLTNRLEKAFLQPPPPAAAQPKSPFE